MKIVAEGQEKARRTVRLRLLSFSTADMLRQELSRSLAQVGLDAEISRAAFGAVEPELLAPAAESTGGLVVLMDARGFHGRDWRQPVEAAHRLLAERTQTFIAALESFATSGSAPVFINSLPSAAVPQTGLLDATHPDGAAFLVHHVNQCLREVASRCPRIVLVDADLAMAGIAPLQRSDPKLWFYGRIPYSALATEALAQALARAIASQTSAPVKVLAIDLDDTLWRGIYGEQGARELECGDEFPGNAYKALQEELLRLRSQGLLLTILSKNDDDVLRVFDEHPGMALKREDFVAHRINWEPKPDNIRALAAELELGLDSFLFLDDSPHEREAMRRLAPEVRVPELPADPALRPDFLRAHAPLWPARLTAEDHERSEAYAARLEGRALQKKAASLEDYFAGLGQQLCVEQVTAAGIGRIAQMHMRTNQFNLTTLRLSESELSTMIADGGSYCVLQGRVADKLGRHGVVICSVAKLTGRSASIESFLMSCRVIGREVEIAFLGAMLSHLQDRGVEEVEVRYIPTGRNGLARQFCEKSGLGPGEATADGGQRWHWRKDGRALPGSNFVRVSLRT